jgi:prepilin-type N-terminal cleavage/methylation domain-containing protein
VSGNRPASHCLPAVPAGWGPTVASATRLATRPHDQAGGRRGFTLVEVMSALSLAGLVLLLLAMAIDTQLRVADKGRVNVEEAQLARALLRRIADDVRGAVRYDPLDVAKLVPQLSTESLGDETAQTESGTEAAGATSGGSGDSETEDEDSETSTTPLVPGIYGDRYELQVDVSRLPRIDQFERSLVSGSSLGRSDRVSDVKTVAYFVVRSESNALAYAEGMANRSGLVRCEMDRAVTSWAASAGTLEEMAADLEPIAPEVLAVEFEYFDGQEWFDEWDSDALGSLPVAVRIGIALDPAHRRNGGRGAPESAENEIEPVVYRMLVHLTASAPMENRATDDAEEESDDEAMDSTETTEDENADGADDDSSTDGSTNRSRNRRKSNKSPTGDSKGDSKQGDALGDLRGAIPDDLRDRIPRNWRDRIPKNMRDRIPQDLPDRIPENLRDRIPSDWQQRIPENVRGRIPGNFGKNNQGKK